MLWLIASGLDVMGRIRIVTSVQPFGPTERCFCCSNHPITTCPQFIHQLRAAPLGVLRSFVPQSIKPAPVCLLMKLIANVGVYSDMMFSPFVLFTRWACHQRCGLRPAEAGWLTYLQFQQTLAFASAIFFLPTGPGPFRTSCGATRTLASCPQVAVIFTDVVFPIILILIMFSPVFIYPTGLVTGLAGYREATV